MPNLKKMLKAGARSHNKTKNNFMFGGGILGGTSEQVKEFFMFYSNGEFKPKGLIGWIVIILILAVIIFVYKRTEHMTGIHFGVGPNVSGDPGEGTYGYLQALTYLPNRRSITDDVTWQLFSERSDEPQSKLDKVIRQDGVQGAIQRAYNVPYATGLGATTIAGKQISSAESRPTMPTEKLANLGGPEMLENLGGPEKLSDIPLRENASNVGYTPSASVLGIATPQFKVASMVESMTPILNEEYIGQVSVMPAKSNFRNTGRYIGKIPKRMREGMTNFIDVTTNKVGQKYANTKACDNPFAVCEPNQLLMVTDGDLGAVAKPVREGFGLTNAMGLKGYRQMISPTPFTSDRAFFLSMSKNKDAQVVESNCDKDGRCQIDYVVNPTDKFSDPIALISLLSKSERDELTRLAGSLSKFEIDAFIRYDSLLKKKQMSDRGDKVDGLKVEFNSLDKQELEGLESLMKIKGKDIKRYWDLVQRAQIKLSEKQYIYPSQTPYNACKVPPGLISVDPDCRLSRKTNFVPANSCDYLDYTTFQPKRLSEGELAQRCGGKFGPIFFKNN